MSKYHDGDWKRKDDYKDKSGLYVPLRNCDVGLSYLRMKDMLAKVLKGVEKIKDCRKEIKTHILGMNQKIKWHATATK